MTLKNNYMQDKWFPASVDTEFDGEYIGEIDRIEQCGTVKRINRVVENKMNKWVLDPNETLVAWRKITPSGYDTHAPGGCPL